MTGQIKKSFVKVGMSVTCKVEVDAYYSGYAGRPVVKFSPGMIGIVGAVDVPKVYYSAGGDSFVCVDFVSPTTGKEERAGLNYNNIVVVDG